MSFELERRVWAIPLPSTDKLVLLCLAHHANPDNGLCYPSTSKIGKDTGLHPKSVSRVLTRLQKRKLVTIKRRMDNSNLFTVTLPRGGNRKQAPKGGGNPKLPYPSIILPRESYSLLE